MIYSVTDFKERSIIKYIQFKRLDTYLKSYSLCHWQKPIQPGSEFWKTDKYNRVRKYMALCLRHLVKCTIHFHVITRPLLKPQNSITLRFMNKIKISYNNTASMFDPSGLWLLQIISLISFLSDMKLMFHNVKRFMTQSLNHLWITFIKYKNCFSIIGNL
jgi:hypothetical protein